MTIKQAKRRVRKTSYIQYSKRVTKWAIILCTLAFAACLQAITLFTLEQYMVSAIVSIYTTYAAILGVVIGAYQTNSGVEKFQRLKKTLDSLNETYDDIDCENG